MYFMHANYLRERFDGESSESAREAVLKRFWKSFDDLDDCELKRKLGVALRPFCSSGGTVYDMKKAFWACCH